MRSINFITAPSPRNQHDTERWRIISSVLFGIIILVIGTKQSMQLWKLAHAQSACISAEQLCHTSAHYLETYRSYAEQLRAITKKLTYLQSVHLSLKKTAQCIQDSATIHHSTLTQCDIKDNQVTLSLQIPQHKKVQEIEHTLTHTDWAEHVLLETITTTQSDSTAVAFNISLKR